MKVKFGWFSNFSIFFQAQAVLVNGNQYYSLSNDSNPLLDCIKTMFLLCMHFEMFNLHFPPAEGELLPRLSKLCVNAILHGLATNRMV